MFLIIRFIWKVWPRKSRYIFIEIWHSLFFIIDIKFVLGFIMLKMTFRKWNRAKINTVTFMFSTNQWKFVDSMYKLFRVLTRKGYCKNVKNLRNKAFVIFLIQFHRRWSILKTRIYLHESKSDSILWLLLSREFILYQG